MARRSTAVEPEGTQMMIKRGGVAAAVMHLADEMLDHLLRHFEIGDDAVPQRADGLDIARGTAQHLLGFLTHGQHMFAAFYVGDGDDRGLRQHDAAAFDIDQRVCRTEVNRHVGGHDAENSTKHSKPSANAIIQAQQGLQPPLGARKSTPALLDSVPYRHHIPAITLPRCRGIPENGFTGRRLDGPELSNGGVKNP